MTREEAIEIIKRNCTSGSDLRKACELFIPELTKNEDETENEDERIRRAIIELLKEVGRDDTGISENVKCMISYLEKQKEQIPYTDFVIKPHKGDDANPYDMQASEALEYAIKRGFGVPFNDGEVYVDVRHMTQTIGNIIRWADEHPKEQKPVECLKAERDKWYICIKDFYAGGKKCASTGELIQAKGGMYMMGREDISEWFRKAYYDEIKPAEWSEDNIKELTDFEAAMLHIGMSFFGGSAGLNPNNTNEVKKQAKLLLELVPKQEWSEEDEKIRQSIIKDIEFTRNYTFATTNKVIGKYNEQINWLKFLRPQITNSTPLYTIEQVDEKIREAQEWSEEDEANLDYLIDFCNSYYNGNTRTLTESTARTLSNWLYRVKSGEISLPKSRLDEKDEKTIHLACEFIRHHARKNDSVGGIDCSELVERLKSLRSQPKVEWSEEQKEQKPVEYLDKDKIYAIMKKLHELAFSHRILIYSDEYKKINEITSDVRSLLDYPIEPQPTEWSNLDKGILNDAITAVDLLGNDESFNKSNPNLANAFRVAKDWLETLPGRFNVKQEKQEWTKEDENMLLKLLMMIDTANDYEEIRLWLCTKLNVVTSTELDRKLKSDMTQLERYISEARAKKGFYWNNKEVSWEEIPLEERKHDYPYYFKNGLDCYPFRCLDYEGICIKID